MRKQRIFILFWVMIIITGIFLFQDYGVSTDEYAQRIHSLINYEYINEKVFGRTVNYIVDLPEYVPLNEYVYKFYNMITQIPMVFVEDLCTFSLTTRTIFLMRHLLTWFYFVIGLIHLFFFLREIVDNKYVSYLGVLLLLLYPRFFGESFYNIKDIVFVAVYLMALYPMIKWIKNKNEIKYMIWLAFYSAIAIYKTGVYDVFAL